jgi:outer membrane receptor protein involved in Fe transport
MRLHNYKRRQKMTKNNKQASIQRLMLRTSAAAIATVGFIAEGSAFAQSDEIIVTGSRIPSTNAIATSPVTTIGNVEFDIRGTTRVEDLVNTLPQAFAAQGANSSNGATGAANVNLRGLGSVRTLVLVDGRRLQYGSSISAASAPDLNQIPSALVERVDVLTGGASAVYGSDAIAGVVNFIMIDDFEGVRIDGQLSGYQHSNNNQDAQGILAFRNQPIPEKGAFDGKGQEITLIVGANTEDGRGNVTAYAGYRNDDAITQDSRDFSACQYGGGTFTATRPFGFGCSGSATNINGTFATPTGTYTLDENGPGNTFRPTDAFTNALSADVFNYAPTNFYQRPDERYVLGAFAHYEVNDHLEFYSQAMFYDYTSDAQIAFTGTFFEPSMINCDNPLMSAQQASLICGANAGLPVNAIMYPGKRFVELGTGRNDHIRLTSYRILAGVRGDIMDGWTYDAFFQYANTHNAQRYENDASITNMKRALDVVDVGGVPTCRSVVNGTDPNCVPLNIFQIGGVTPAQLAYVSFPSFQDGNTFLYNGQATFTGDLGQYGLALPWAESGVSLAGGVEWRKDGLRYNPDALFLSGDLAGQGGTSPVVDASVETTDFFIEAEIPLVEGMAFAERLAFSGGYRHSDVSTAGTNSTWKLQGDWQVTPDIRFRGGWQRATRAPNVLESFQPQNSGLTQLTSLNGLSDPCAGAMPNATFAQCANTGVTAAQYGSIGNNPAHQYNAVFGGNPNLVPEVSDTYTIGVVLTPGDYLPGKLFVSVDYFDIFVDDFISAPSGDNILTQCVFAGDPKSCSLITRSPGSGSLWLNSDTGFITLYNVNTGSFATSGVDINANYSIDIGKAGGLSFDLVGTYLIDFLIEEVDGLPKLACEGKYSGPCDIYSTAPLAAWRHKLRTTWETPLGVDATVTWRYFSSVDLFGVTNPDPSVDRNDTLGSRNYIDVAASYNLTDKWNVRIGANNLLDKDPPLTAQQTGLNNGNTYPQTYDSLGRYLFVGTTVDF